MRATFKIDLDQVFPQEELLETMGASAFELLCTPLWGAHGRDAQDRSVSLGMIAGALVNELLEGRPLRSVTLLAADDAERAFLHEAVLHIVQTEG